MNIFTTHHADLEKAFDTLEGDGFYDKSMNANENSLKAAIQAFEDLKSSCKLQSHQENLPIGKPIHGRKNNRYYLYIDGSIKFSKGHGSKSGWKKARKLGFELT